MSKDWTDKQVKDYADPSGTGGWYIRKNGNPFLKGDPERRVCKDRVGNA